MAINRYKNVDDNDNRLPHDEGWYWARRHGYSEWEVVRTWECESGHLNVDSHEHKECGRYCLDEVEKQDDNPANWEWGHKVERI